MLGNRFTSVPFRHVADLTQGEQVKLTCTSFGPGNCEKAVYREIEKLLNNESGRLNFNTHGLDEEGWGPIRANYLEQLLERLQAIETVEIFPVGKVLARIVDQPNP